jgi:hypothetical protein
MKDFKKDIETFIKSGLQELSDILRTIAGSLQTINGILHLNPDEIKKGLSNTGKSLLQGSNDFNSWILGNGQATVPGGAEVPDYGTLLKNAAQNFKNRMMYGPGYESYIHPTSQNNHVQNHVEMSQTNYFYGGGDSLSLASAVGDKNSQLLTRLVRNMQGVMI